MKKSIINEEIYTKDNEEYISLLSLEKPSWLWVINRDLFDFLLNPNKILEENEDINKSDLLDIIDPLIKKNLIDLNNPFFDDIRLNENGENKTIKSMSTWIHLTNQCNLDCSYCYIWKDKSKMTKEVMEKTIESLKNTINDEWIEKIWFSLAWGEPLMNFSLLKDFVEKVKKEIPVKSTFSIVTNWTLLDKEKIEFLNENNFSMYVSLDWLWEDNDIQRYFKWWEWSFDKVISWINKLEKLFKWKLTIWIVVWPDNVNWLPKLTKFLLEKWLQFKFSFYRPNENSSIDNYIFNDFQKNLISSLRTSFNIIKDKAWETFNPENIFDKMSINWWWSKKVCTMWEKYFAISHKWEISSCHMTQWENLFKIDSNINILKELSEISNKIHNITADSLECRNCSIVNICKWWCRLVIDENTQKSIYHDTYIELFNEYIDLIAHLQWKHKK